MQKIIRITFYIVLFLFLLDIFDVFQTKIGLLKAIIYYMVFALPVPLLIIEFKADKHVLESFLRIAIPILTIIGLIYLHPMKILFNASAWKTQTVYQIDKNRENHKVEFQMKDMGALGYVKRNVEVYYLTDYFYVVLAERYDYSRFLDVEWKSVDQNINEMGLK